MSNLSVWIARQLRQTAGAIDKGDGSNRSGLPQRVEYDPKSPLGVLLVAVQEHLGRLGKEQGRHKRETTQITLVTVGLSAMSSVLLGMNFDPQSAGEGWLTPMTLKNLALVFTAMVAVINAYDALFKPHRLWVREGRTYGLLKDLRLKLEICAAGSNGGKDAKPEAVEVYRQELETMLREDLDSWVRQHGEGLLGGGKEAPGERGSAPAGAAGKPPVPV
jgi:hypothetical protein